MTVPSTPAEMQAHVLTHLLAGRDKKPKQDTKAQLKLAKSIGKNVETRLRDRLFHETRIEIVGVSESGFLSFADTSTNTTPISVFWSTDKSPTAILRCDNIMAALLSRLCYGGDIEAEVHPSENGPTDAELGLLQIFSVFIARSIEKMGLASITNTTTVDIAEFEPDELPDTKAVICKFTIRIGITEATMELAIPETMTLGTADNAENDDILSVGTTNEEVTQADVNAIVKLKPLPTTLKRVRTLKVGDRLPLGTSGPLEGRFIVNGREIFNCEIGRSGEAYSLKIADGNIAAKNKAYSQLLVS